MLQLPAGRTGISSPAAHAEPPKAADGPWKAANPSAPQVMAMLRNHAIAIMKVAGAAGIAATNRHYARNATRPLATLGLIPA